MNESEPAKIKPTGYNMEGDGGPCTGPPAPEQSDAKAQDSDGVTRKDVESWMRYFDEHAEEFVAAHKAIIRKARSDAEPVNGILEASLPGIDDVCPDVSAGLIEAASNLVDLVEGVFGWGTATNAKNVRLKDTPEWVSFYNKVAELRAHAADRSTK